jgi:hypothetical protein
MTLIDATDSVVMLGAYGWAFVKPIRDLYKNINDHRGLGRRRRPGDKLRAEAASASSKAARSIISSDLVGRESERRNRERVSNHENDVMLPKCSSSSKALESWYFYAECLYPRDEF